MNLLPSSANRKLLDCGCGAGSNAQLLKAAGWRVTGITASRKEAYVAAAHCELVYLADLELGIPDEVGRDYAAVLLSHVLEHLLHPQNVLRDARRILTRDGIVAVALPNVMFYRNRLRLMLGKFEYQDSGIMDETHVRFYTFDTATMLLNTNGFQIVSQHADGSAPLSIIRKLLPSGVAQQLDRWAAAVLPGLFGGQILILARPATHSVIVDEEPR